VETKSPLRRYWRQGDDAMMITMLAAAMTLAMLIATVLSIREEAQRAKARQRQRIRNPYMYR
jgi:hypothetical protein